MENNSEKLYSASIRVVKSLSEVSHSNFFGILEVLHYPMIGAKSKEEVKQNLIELHPEFFQNGKIYERETKDSAQFFYVIISEVGARDLKLISEGQWVCDCCGQLHPNKYVKRPRITYKFGDTKHFCDEKCYSEFKRNLGEDGEDYNYITKDSPHYIYKITEKTSGKCYIGKTRNYPFFRWWNHLKHSKTPFGKYFGNTDICNWTFEVIQTLPANTDDNTVMYHESMQIRHHNSIENGFNVLVSNKNFEL